MFSISTLVDVVRIPPSLFGTTLKKAAVNILKEKYVSMINAELGYIIMILDAKVDEMGKMIAGDGGTFHKVEFEALTFYPKLQEIVQGEIVDITDFTKFSMAILEYMAKRHLNVDDTNYYWSPSLGYRDRLIIPFYYEGRIVGWTARTVTPDKNPKYLTDSQPGFVYGLDEQRPQKVFCIVCEGPVDAIHVEGCALTGSEISEQQAMLLNRLHKDIIVVPDRDSKGRKLVEQALDLGWSVSMPEWDENINDIGDCVQCHGRLYTLYSIVAAAERSSLKIKLRMKKWFG